MQQDAVRGQNERHYWCMYYEVAKSELKTTHHFCRLFSFFNRYLLL